MVNTSFGVRREECFITLWDIALLLSKANYSSLKGQKSESQSLTVTYQRYFWPDKMYQTLVGFEPTTPRTWSEEHFTYHFAEHIYKILRESVVTYKLS